MAKPQSFLPNCIWFTRGQSLQLAVSSDNMLDKTSFPIVRPFVFIRLQLILIIGEFRTKEDIMAGVKPKPKSFAPKTLAGLNANLAFSKMAQHCHCQNPISCDAFDLHGWYLWVNLISRRCHFLLWRRRAVCPDNGNACFYAEVPFDLKSDRPENF